jgi:prevent-host-death family protein
MKMEAKKIQSSIFKAKCLEILDSVPPEGLIITKRGEPVAKLMPFRSGGSIFDCYGSMKDELKVHGNIFHTGEKWDAES